MWHDSTCTLYASVFLSLCKSCETAVGWLSGSLLEFVHLTRPHIQKAPTGLRVNITHKNN